MTVDTKGTNGVSYGIRHTVTSTGATDGVIVFDFKTANPLAATVQITRSDAVVTGDVVITYPDKGQVSVANGATYNLTAGDVISLVAQFARGDV